MHGTDLLKYGLQGTCCSGVTERREAEREESLFILTRDNGSHYAGKTSSLGAALIV